MTDTIFEPEVKVSKQALERQQRFRSNKDINGLTDKVKTLSRPVTVYFNEQGEITCVTKDADYKPDESWFTHDFTSVETAKVRNRSFSEFIVVKSEVQGKDHYEIQNVKGYNDRSATHQINYQEVTWSPSWDLDLTQLEVSVTKNKIILNILQPGLDYIKQYEKSDYQIKNQKFLSVFITVKKNPHYLAYEFKVPVTDFLNGDTIEHLIDPEFDYTSYSVYTKPLFDYCARV